MNIYHEIAFKKISYVYFLQALLTDTKKLYVLPGKTWSTSSFPLFLLHKNYYVCSYTCVSSWWRGHSQFLSLKIWRWVVFSLLDPKGKNIPESCSWMFGYFVSCHESLFSFLWSSSKVSSQASWISSGKNHLLHCRSTRPTHINRLCVWIRRWGSRFCWCWLPLHVYRVCWLWKLWCSDVSTFGKWSWYVNLTACVTLLLPLRSNVSFPVLFFEITCAFPFTLYSDVHFSAHFCCMHCCSGFCFVKKKMLKACLGNMNIWVGKVIKLVLEGTLTALEMRPAACFLCSLVFDCDLGTPYQQTRSTVC